MHALLALHVLPLIGLLLLALIFNLHQCQSMLRHTIAVLRGCSIMLTLDGLLPLAAAVTQLPDAPLLVQQLR